MFSYSFKHFKTQLLGSRVKKIGDIQQKNLFESFIVLNINHLNQKIITIYLKKT